MQQIPPPTPYAPPGHFRPPAQKRGRSVFVMLLCGVVGVVLLFVGVMAVGVWALGEDAARIMRSHPVAIQHLGDVSDCKLDIGSSMTDERTEWMHYRCVGAASSARAILRTEPTGPDGREELVEGQLVLPSGERIALTPR